MQRQSLAAAAIGLAGLVLLGSGAAPAASVSVEANLGQPVMHAGRTDRIYVKVGLKGLVATRPERRTPVNVALVLDRSGSMQGARIQAAREAAKMAVDRLGSEDIVSIVAYNHNVDIVQAAGRVGSHSELKSRIDELKADGRTALYAGVQEGARQVRRNLSPYRVNRIILMSDGLANVGPSTPKELADLGRELAREGITVTTIGLGLDYNEDLMQRLAAASDGNHAFVEHPDRLVKIFNAEFGDVLSISAQDVIITIHCRAGFRPVRVMGRDGSIDGSTIKLKLSHLNGLQEKYVVVELEVPRDRAAGETEIVEVEVDYMDLESKARRQTRAPVRGRFSASADEAEASLDKRVMAEVATQIATEKNEEAVSLRDKGDAAGAKKLLELNAQYLRDKARQYSSGAAPAAAAVTGRMSDLEKRNVEAAESLSPEKWEKTRKLMREDQHRSKVQQSY